MMRLATSGASSAVLVLFCFLTGMEMADTMVPATLQLNDTRTNTSSYLCTYGFTGHFPSLVPSILIDVRDLVKEHTSLSYMVEAVTNRINYVKLGPSISVQNFDNISLLMPENITVMQHLDNTLEISIFLILTNNIPIDSMKYNISSAGRIFFVTDGSIDNLLSQRVESKSLSGLVLDFVDPPSYGIGYLLLAFFILQILSFITTLFAALIVLRNHEELLLTVHKIRPDVSSHSFLRVVVPFLLILCSISVILLAYFFYDVMVYFFIAVFVFAGASAMSSVTSTLLFMKAPALKHVAFKIHKFNVNVIRLILFLVYLSFTITWFVFRNDQSIGWIMQDIIGVFLIIQILTDVSIFLTFKTICFGFAIFVIYDVFFVFISPFLVSSAKGSAPAEPVETETVEVLSRHRRGIASPGSSIMEAVATGSAGSSGELVPLVFKVSLSAIANRHYGCVTKQDYALFGFGDVVFPGALCVFLIFYDACWKRGVPWNFLCSLLGVGLGCVAVSVVLFVSKMAQPALLYLCPLSLATTVAGAYLRGGAAELRNLWNSNLPHSARVLDNTNNASDSAVVFYALEGQTASNDIDEHSNLPSVVEVDENGNSTFYKDQHLNL